MISFELFYEKCQAPVEVLDKYKDDPNVFISFTNIIEPRGGKEGTSKTKITNKSTNRIGLNPLTSYDTPAGVYTYPLKDYWNNIKSYDIPYVKDMPYVYVLKPKNPDRCARISSYTQEDFERDAEELSHIYPKYHIEDLISGDDTFDKYPDYGGNASLHISDSYRTPPLRFFWSLTRSLAYLIEDDIRKKNETKTKHITIWTHIMRQFYDGIIDDRGTGTIHTNEPYQAVFWTKAQLNVLDIIDRTCGKKKIERGSITRDEWIGSHERKTTEILKKDQVYNIITKAFISGRKDSLNDGLKKLVKDTGLYNLYTQMENGEPYLWSVDFDGIVPNNPISL